MTHKEHWRNGQRLVSVTELTSIISKPYLDKWKEGLCEPTQQLCGFIRAKQVAEEASDLGNKVHEDVAAYLTSGNSPTTDWGIRIVSKLTEMRVSKYLIEPESTLIDEESGLAGSPDFIGTMEGSNGFVGDLKIKNSLDLLTGMQGMGYRYLVRRKFEQDLTKMLVVWAKKKTKSRIVEPVWIDLTQWERPWKSLIEVWNTLNPKRKVTVL